MIETIRHCNTQGTSFAPRTWLLGDLVLRLQSVMLHLLIAGLFNIRGYRIPHPMHASNSIAPSFAALSAFCGPLQCIMHAVTTHITSDIVYKYARALLRHCSCACCS